MELIMTTLKKIAVLTRPMAFLLSLVLVSISCSNMDSDTLDETFSSPGDWGSGVSSEVEGQVQNDVYDMLVKSNHGMYLASAGKNFVDGVYEVEATQIDGPLNNGYGMLFRLDDATDSYYVFEVSGDGYIWIGYCSDLCETEAVALVGGDWYRSPAVKPGLQETNSLKVITDGPRMTFFVNGIEVGRSSDSRLTEGDIAVMVEALGEPGVHVAFDNFKVTPP
jgi:hypothetical protein